MIGSKVPEFSSAQELEEYPTLYEGVKADTEIIYVIDICTLQ
jgi:hypothetical protein